MEKKRWLVVVGALLIQICLGAIYAWGTFVPALKASKAELTIMLSPELLGIDPAVHKELSDEFRALKSEIAAATGEAKEAAQAKLSTFLKETVEAKAPVDEAVWGKQHFGFNGRQTQGIFSIGLLTFALVMIFAGRWQDRAGPKVVAMAGGVVLGAGYILASFMGTNFLGLLFFIGVVGGAGIGLGYVCPIAACVKWFPDLKGLITGLAVAGFGAGAFIFIKLAGAWANLVSLHGVHYTFMVFGIIFLVSVVIGSLLLSNPPQGWTPAGWAPKQATTGPAARSVCDLTQGECVRTSSFWMIWLAFVFSAGCGLMVIGCLKDFGVREGGLTEAAAGSALGLLALFNGLGRIVWGTVSQKLGSRRAIIAMTLLQAIMMFAIRSMGSSVGMLTFAACWIGFNFGGNFALFPLITTELFGTKNLGANYGAVFTAYGIGGILGPMHAGGVWDMFQSYQWAFLPGAIGCLIAMALAMFLHTETRLAGSSPEQGRLASPPKTAGAH